MQGFHIVAFVAFAILARWAYQYYTTVKRVKAIGFEVRYAWNPQYLAIFKKLFGSFKGNYPPGWPFERAEEIRGNCCVIGPFGFYAYISEPKYINEISMRKTDFPKPLEQYKILDIFGTNVLTTEGALWKLHRKITGPPFNERNNALVFQETVHQTRGMMDEWSKYMVNGSVLLEDARKDCMKLALHVICGAGFGQSFSWAETSTITSPDHRLSFRDSMSEMLHHLAVPLLFGKFLRKVLRFKYIKDGDLACKEYEKYMDEMLDKERESAARGDKGRANLLSALVRSEEQGQILSRDEIKGNMFIFIIAGHETTANSLLYAYLLLAMHPEVQGRLYEETTKILSSEPTYADFPKMVYALCIMFETLRIFPPVILIPKSTPNMETPLLGHILPAKQVIYIDVVGVHRNPDVYPDPHTFNPSRFDGRGTMAAENEKAAEKGSDDFAEEGAPGASYQGIRMPPKGCFLPFSEGYRACLGRKFSQVEFACALSVMSLRFKFALAPGWSNESMRKALDASETIITLQPATELPIVITSRT